MSVRREKGTGNIYKRKNGNWVGRLNTGNIKEDGSPVIKYFSGKTEAEVKRKIREYNKSTYFEPVNVTFGVYITEWLTTFKRNILKQSSYDTLENTVKKHIIPITGVIQLSQINAKDIQKLINTYINQGKSYSFVKKIYDCMSAVMKYAIANRDIQFNPMLNVAMPKQSSFSKKEIKILTPEETKLLLNECRQYNRKYDAAIVIALNTGLRIGEICALDYTEFDARKRELHIKQNAQVVKNREGQIPKYIVSVTTPKTPNSIRTIPLNDYAFEAVEKYLSVTNGNPVHPSRIENCLHKALAKLGMEQFGMHPLRHTFASLLFANNVDVKTVSKLLGHSSIRITLDTYIHLIEGTDKDAVNILNSI